MLKEPYTRLDDRLLRDDKIRALRRATGYEGIGIYLSLLTLISNYRERAYQIPFASLEDIAECDMQISLDKLREVVDVCINLELFKSNETTFWSERKKNDLLKAEEAIAKMSEAGRRGINKRWSK